MAQASRSLAEFLAHLSLEDTPVAIRHEAKRMFLDTLGGMIAGSRSELGPMARSHGALFGKSGEASVVGLTDKSSMMAAIYANGRIANAMDFDETYPTGAHFGVGAFAAALTLGQLKQQTGEEILLSLIAGYELGARLATALGATVEIEDERVVGFPKIWGLGAPAVMAATGAACKALSQSADEFEQAIGISATNTPVPVGGHWATLTDLPNCKYNDAGWCAVTGVFSAFAAEQGTTGFTEFLDADPGLLHVYGSNAEGSKYLVNELGTEWMLNNITYKPWPNCRLLHYPLTALKEIIDTHQFGIGDIEKIKILGSPLGMSKRFTNTDPKTFASLQFSIPHNVAMLLMDVPLDQWLDFDVGGNTQYKTLISKIEIISHPQGYDFCKTFENNQWRTMPGGAVLTVNGRELSAETDYAWGDPWSQKTRFDDVDIISKFVNITRISNAGEIAEYVLNMDEMPNLDLVYDILQQV